MNTQGLPMLQRVLRGLLLVALLLWLLPLGELLARENTMPALLVGYGLLGPVLLPLWWLVPHVAQRAPYPLMHLVAALTVGVIADVLALRLLLVGHSAPASAPPLGLYTLVLGWAVLFLVALALLKADPQRVKWRELGTLTLFSLLFTLLATEILLRVAFRQMRGRIWYDVITAGEPNPWWHYVSRARPLNAQYLIHSDYGVLSVFFTNAHGLYDHDYSYDKPPDVFRILFLGDSLTESKETPLADIFHQRLEDRLREEGRGVEIIAAGVTGWGASDALLYLEHEGCRYQPDMVVLDAFPTNDVGNNHHTTNAWQVQEMVGIGGALYDAFLRFPYYELAQDGELVARNLPMQGEQTIRQLTLSEQLGATLARYSRIYLILHRWIVFYGENIGNIPYPAELVVYYEEYPGVEPQIMRDMRGVNALTYLQPDTPVMIAAWDITARLMERMREVAADCGAETFAVVVIPQTLHRDVYAAWMSRQLEALRAQAPAFWEPFRYRDGDARFAELMDELGIPVLRLWDVLDAPDSEVYIPGDGHFTPYGHQLVAEALYQWMTAQEWLPPVQ